MINGDQPAGGQAASVPIKNKILTDEKH